MTYLVIIIACVLCLLVLDNRVDYSIRKAEETQQKKFDLAMEDMVNQLNDIVKAGNKIRRTDKKNFKIRLDAFENMVIERFESENKKKTKS